MVGRLVVLVAALAGCASDPEDVSFDDTAGWGAGMGDCICSYDNGSEGGPMTVEVTCSQADKFSGISFFIDPTTPSVDQPASIIFEPADVSRSYAAGATGQAGTLGEAKQPDKGKDQIIRSIDGLEFRWIEQDACNAADGCVDQYHLQAGSVTGGAGGCEDFWASVDQASS